MEIERKFLVEKKDLPDNYEQYPSRQLEQGYICVSPAIRIRRDEEKYIFTCKGEGALTREEFELPLSRESYEHLKTKVDGNWIKKQRFFLPVHPDGTVESPSAKAELTIELDIFDEPFAPLIYAEVEFPTEEAAKAFIPPQWFGKDVTLLPEYQNSALSERKAAACSTS